MNTIKYSDNDKIIWDEFVRLSRNNHFFFLRDFMEYHSDRFIDHSLMFYDENNKLIALLPASLNDKKLVSHGGLSFGGLILKATAKQKDVISVFKIIKKYMLESGIDSLVYKKTPEIYSSIPSEEDLYALFVNDAKLIRRDVSSAIKVKNQIKYSKGRKWVIKKSKEMGLTYSEEKEYSYFWSQLENTLLNNHGVKPVHSLEEIELLVKKFPKNIKVFSARLNDEILAGAVVFETGEVAHTQYLFNTPEGRGCGALDGLVDHLINVVYTQKEYFDFGISNENQGRFLNTGLIAQKEGFGARAITHDFYEVVVND